MDSEYYYIVFFHLYLYLHKENIPNYIKMLAITRRRTVKIMPRMMSHRYDCDREMMSINTRRQSELFSIGAAQT